MSQGVFLPLLGTGVFLTVMGLLNLMDKQGRPMALLETLVGRPAPKNYPLTTIGFLIVLICLGVKFFGYM